MSNNKISEFLCRLHIKQAYIMSDNDIEGAINECEMAAEILWDTDNYEEEGYTYEDYLEKCDEMAVFPQIGRESFEKIACNINISS